MKKKSKERLFEMMNMVGGMPIKEVYQTQEYHYLSTKYANSRIIMTKDDEIKFYRPSEPQEIDYKPKGLWYGLGAEWVKEVNAAYEYNLDDDDERELPVHERNFFEIKLNESKMRVIRTYDEIIAFTEEFKPQLQTYDFFKENMIDWDRVSKQYSGIEIIPYIIEARMKRQTNWYYTWDIASGCVWLEDAILDITKLQF